jgi:hypothetical protein
MDCVLRKISRKDFDDDVHSEFIKFSKGNFDFKYLIDAKKQKDKWAIKTGSEYANFLVRRCVEKASGKISVKGVIVSTFDLKKDMPFEISGVKQFMGVKQIMVDCQVSPNQIIELMDKYPRAFFALSFSVDGCDLKIKAKAPKSAKPAAAGEKEPSPEFCSLKTADSDMVKNLFFDVESFSEISIKHAIKINDIRLPAGEKDPVKIRENAKRIGVVVRRIKVDGKEMTKEYPFEA